jgi:hypothetical protein
MATQEERLDNLEERIVQNEAGSITLLGIVKEVNDKVDGLIGSTRSIQVNAAIVDARLNAIDARMGVMAARLDQQDIRMGSMESKIDQVISLLRKDE